MPFIYTPDHNTSEVRQAEQEALKRVAARQKEEAKRRDEERRRALAAEAALKARSTSLNK
ncbi:MAG TPA: hypothetical protein VL294_03610 [Pseudolysinimonas sp.]|jgi:hypothetical protein|nr:hypothetical protein [Pseudolysinimonas sp.]